MEKVRGRKPIEVTKDELQTAINNLEQSQPDGKFPNRSALWASLESSEWAKSRTPRPLTGQVAYTLAKKFDTTINTPVGQKGRLKGQVVVSGSRPRKLITLNLFEKSVPNKNDNGQPIKANIVSVIKKAEKGSLKACIKLKCLDCSNWIKSEVAKCTVTSCPLFPVRPYKREDQTDDAEPTDSA